MKPRHKVLAYKYILRVNGFRDAWINPIHTCENFHKVLKQRLNDQFIQKWKSSVLSSKRFTVLSTLFSRYGMTAYLTTVKNPDIIYIYIYIHGWELILMSYLRLAVAKISKICVLFVTLNPRRYHILSLNALNSLSYGTNSTIMYLSTV